MRYLIIIIFIWTNYQCSSLGDTRLISAEIIYLEPFPFTSLDGDAMVPYKQAAWIKIIDSNDSLAVLFDYTITGGKDALIKYSLNKPYKFLLKKYSLPVRINSEETVKSQTDSLARKIESSPVIFLVDSSKLVKSNEYWLVLSINNI